MIDQVWWSKVSQWQGKQEHVPITRTTLISRMKFQRQTQTTHWPQAQICKPCKMFPLSDHLDINFKEM